MKNMSKILSLAVLTVGISTSFASAEGYVFSENAYKVGMYHNDIKVIQEALKKDGTYTYGTTTTYFGPITEKAVISFQKKNGLTADGVVGKGTLSKMNQIGLIEAAGNTTSSSSAANKSTNGYVFSEKAYKPGMEHKDVKVIQETLKKDGVYTFGKYTTYYGTETEKAVKAFQKKYSLTADGIVGKGTLNKMKELGLLPDNVTITTTTAAVSRGSVARKVGQYLDWFSEVKGKIVERQDVLLIEDLETGKRFQVKVTAGTNHADVETLTLDDTQVMKNIWGGFSWDRRAVLVYKDENVIAASMTFMPHAGVESKPGGETVSGRSGGYGTGYNFDFIKDNGIDGHVDLHFKNSLRHKDDKKDPQHQSEVKKAAGIK